MSDRHQHLSRTTAQRMRAVASAALLAAACGAHAESPAADEASLREAIASFVATWNRHDLKAWSAILTADVDYRDYAHGPTGRDAAVSLWGHNVNHQDLHWDVLRVKMQPDGRATVVMRTELRVPPVRNGKYQQVFQDDPAVSRWRVEDGQWRLYFFTSFKPRAVEIVQAEGLQ